MRTGTVAISAVHSEAHRLTGGFHLSEDQVAVSRLNAFKGAVPLHSLTKGRGVFRGAIFKRRYVDDADLGSPYVSGSDLLQADVRPASYLSPRLGAVLEDLSLKRGMILVTCSGMNLGDVIWTRDDIAGLVATHDLIRVVPDPGRIPPGYLYAFLLSRYGHAYIRKQIYGGNIKHVEPEQLSPMPVPRLGQRLEERIHNLAMESAKSRTTFVAEVRAATKDLLAEVGLEDTRTGKVNHGRSFVVRSSQFQTLRAVNHDPGVQTVLDRIKSSGFRTLGAICEGGQLSTGKRFRRVDADPEHGVRLVGQKHGFWMRPHGRWISPSHAPPDVFAEDETVLIASAGTLGRRELYCRPILATGSWLDNVYTQHFLRVVSADETFPGAYLFAFLRSELAFHVLRSMSTGSKQQEIHRELIADLPIPAPPEVVRMRIAERVRTAYKIRDEADRAEAEALSLTEQAIEEAT